MNFSSSMLKDQTKRKQSFYENEEIVIENKTGKNLTKGYFLNYIL